MPNFNSLKMFWDRLSANTTPFAPGNQPYLIPCHEDLRAHEDSPQVPDPSPYELPREHRSVSRSRLHSSTSNSPAFLLYRDKFDTQDQRQHRDFTDSHAEHVQITRPADTTTSSPPNEHTQPRPKLSPQPTPSRATTTGQATMIRKRSASRRSSGSSSNSSAHLARAALEAIQRVYTSRSVQISPSASPTSTTRESFEPAPSDTLSSMHSSSSTITPPAGYPTAHHQTAPAPTERTPLLSTFSPVVSPLGPSKSFSPGHTHPPEPFPDLEPGPGSPSDSSYEGLDVFGTHQPRRRWDLGASGGGGGQLRQNKRCEAWDACLLIYFFAVFVLVTVGGGAVLFWVLLHQS